MKRNIWHVSPHPNEWQLKRRNGKRATRGTDKQSESIRIAHNNQPSQLIIRDRNDTIRVETNAPTARIRRVYRDKTTPKTTKKEHRHWVKKPDVSFRWP